MMGDMKRLVLIACLLSLLPGCQAIRKLTAGKAAKEDEDSGPSTLFIGTIELVNPDQHFVLIRSAAHLMLMAGTEIHSVNAQGLPTKLKVTPEHKGSFIAADIVSGTPAKGDQVTYAVTNKTAPTLDPNKVPVRGGVDTIAPPASVPTEPSSTAPLAPFPFPVPNQESVPAPVAPPPQSSVDGLRPVPSVPVSPR